MLRIRINRNGKPETSGLACASSNSSDARSCTETQSLAVCYRTWRCDQASVMRSTDLSLCMREKCVTTHLVPLPHAPTGALN